MARDIWIVLPVKGIERGKRRLSGAIDALSRARLNRWLLEHTLAMVKDWSGDLRKCIVVSPCQGVLALARGAGATIAHEAPHALGLNAAAALGARCATRNGASRVLVLHCDLPGLTGEALEAMCRTANFNRQIALAPDRTGTGTNALLVPTNADFAFSFGRNSLARHRTQAASRGWAVSIVARPELAFDLDTPEDYAAWLRTRSQGSGQPEFARARRLRQVNLVAAG